MTKLSLRHKFLYRNSGFHPENGRTNDAQLDGDGKRDLASERQRIAGSGDGVLARVRCRVVTEMVRPHPGWLRCFNVAWLPQGIHSTLRLSTTCDQRCGNHTPFRKCVKCQKAKDSRLSARYLYPPVAASLNEIVGGEKSQSQKVKKSKRQKVKVKKSKSQSELTIFA